MDKIIEELKQFVAEKGFIQEDKRLNRKTMSLPGHMIVVNKAEMDGLIGDTLDKYKEDWRRMYASFKIATQNAVDDPNSRRLVVLNDSRFNKIYQCFTHVQFVYTHRNEFDIYAYLRSSDIDKLKDDCTFFVWLANKFQIKVGTPVTKLVVVFGHVHYEMTDVAHEQAQK